MKSIRIGTRKSPLALWQAREVARYLQNRNYKTEIIPIVSSGDKKLSEPLYQMGITGIFTRDLDQALLEGKIDVAVHSLKDVPTLLPEGLELICYLKRDFPQDVLVRSKSAIEKPLHELKVATSSLRRRAFWAERFEGAEFTDIRGNVQTRLDKLEEGLADATLFSRAGLERLSLPTEFEPIDFMISAPSQGVVTVAAHSSNSEIKSLLEGLNDKDTEVCVEIERDFLRTLEGGCTAPIGAFAEVIGEEIRFKGKIASLDGKDALEIEEAFATSTSIGKGVEIAHRFLEQGAKKIMETLRGAL